MAMALRNSSGTALQSPFFLLVRSLQPSHLKSTHFQLLSTNIGSSSRNNPTTPTTGGSCGAGNIGNGLCADSSLCCSKWGYCGSSDGHCSETAPVDTATPAPAPITQTTVPTSSTQTPTSTFSTGGSPSPTDDWVLSAESRCRASEADARGNCRQTCGNSGECADGEYCWDVLANYCDSKPAAEECNNAPKGGSACGTSELMAHETCGATCSNDGECNIAGGESSDALTLNFWAC